MSSQVTFYLGGVYRSYNPSRTCETLPCHFPSWIVPSTYLGPRCDLRCARADLGKSGDDLDASPSDPRISQSRSERVEAAACCAPVGRTCRVETRADLQFQCQVGEGSSSSRWRVSNASGITSKRNPYAHLPTSHCKNPEDWGKKSRRLVWHSN